MSEIFGPEFYQSNFLKVITKSGEISSFYPNVYQKQLNRLIEDKRRRLEPIRLQGLKCRQIGFSTWGAAIAYQFTATDFHKSALIIADDEKNTAGIFEKSKMFWEMSPLNIRPMRRRSNSFELLFNNPNDEAKLNQGLNSSLRIQTAGNLRAGRSKTVQILHLSEMAFWPNAGVVKSGLLQAVPLSSGTIIINESTANGITGQGEQFYNDWHDSDFTKIFFKWTHNHEYEYPVGNDFVLTDYEKELLEIHPEMNNRKLAFRRYKIKNEMGSAKLSPQDQFRQEFPLTPEEAFISSGRPVFDVDKVRGQIERLRSTPVLRGDIDSGGKFYESDRGLYKIFKKPVEGVGYAIGADVALGLETGDFSTMSVINLDMEIVATYFGHTAPDIFGSEMVKLGSYYNKAVLAPEINGHGHAVMSKIKDLNYYNIYSREMNDEIADKETKKLGWLTSAKTKMKMLDEFVAAHRDDTIKIFDIELLQEMLTVFVDSDGDINLNGKDRVVSACVALQSTSQIVIPGQLKAFVPSESVSNRDITKMTIEEKLKFYKRR